MRVDEDKEQLRGEEEGGVAMGMGCVWGDQETTGESKGVEAEVVVVRALLPTRKKYWIHEGVGCFSLARLSF